MEIRNKFFGMAKFICSEPGSFIFRTFISRPADLVEEFALAMAVQPGIQNGINLILYLTIDLNGRQRIDSSVRNRAGRCEF